MTDRPMKLIVDIEAGTQQYIPLTDEEIAQHEVDAQLAEIERAERDAYEAAKIAAKEAAHAKLTALGLTPEEIAAL